MTLHNLKPATIMSDTLLNEQDYLDCKYCGTYQFSPDYVRGEYDPSHYDQGLIDLFMQPGQYTHADLMYVVYRQHAHMANVLPM